MVDEVEQIAEDDPADINMVDLTEDANTMANNNQPFDPAELLAAAKAAIPENLQWETAQANVANVLDEAVSWLFKPPNVRNVGPDQKDYTVFDPPLTGMDSDISRQYLSNAARYYSMVLHEAGQKLHNEATENNKTGMPTENSTHTCKHCTNVHHLDCFSIDCLQEATATLNPVPSVLAAQEHPITITCLPDSRPLSKQNSMPRPSTTLLEPGTRQSTSVTVPASTAPSSRISSEEYITSLCIETLASSFSASLPIEGEDLFDQSDLGSSYNRQWSSISEYQKQKAYHRHVPITLLAIEQINGQKYQRPVVALLDTGSQVSLINKCCLPSTVKPIPTHRPLTGIGQVTITEEVELSNLMLPELSRSKRIEESFRCLVRDAPEQIYDVILGLDFLVPVGINLISQSEKIIWHEHACTFKEKHHFSTQKDVHIATIEALATDPEEDPIKIKEAKYEKVKVDDVISQQTHLNCQQKQDLRNLLSKFTTLFSGKLGTYPHKKMHLELIPNAQSVHKRAYPVPHAHLEIFKKELDHLVRIGVLEPCGWSEWASPSFIIPKKDGRVRWVSDFRD